MQADWKHSPTARQTCSSEGAVTIQESPRSFSELLRGLTRQTTLILHSLGSGSPITLSIWNRPNLLNRFYKRLETQLQLDEFDDEILQTSRTAVAKLVLATVSYLVSDSIRNRMSAKTNNTVHLNLQHNIIPFVKYGRNFSSFHSNVVGTDLNEKVYPKKCSVRMNRSWSFAWFVESGLRKKLNSLFG